MSASQPDGGERDPYQPPEYASSSWDFLKEFLWEARISIVLVVLGFVVFTAAAYLLIPDEPVILYLGAGALYTGGAWYLFEASTLWRGTHRVHPADAVPSWAEQRALDLSVRRGACVEALVVFPLANAGLLWLLGSDLWVTEVWLASMAASAAFALLWLSLEVLHWPKLLMPAMYRKDYDLLSSRSGAKGSTARQGDCTRQLRSRE